MTVAKSEDKKPERLGQGGVRSVWAKKPSPLDTNACEASNQKALA